MHLLLFIVSLALASLSGPAAAATYAVKSDIIGAVSSHIVAAEDNLYAVARRFDLGIVELLAANPGVDAWQPEPGTVLTIPAQRILPPAPHEGIVINLAELRLYFYPDEDTVMTFPVGIGREGWQTPTGRTTITAKRKDPSWTPPNSIRMENPDLPAIVPPGPDNPLGAFAMNLGWSGFTIHGTNRPYGIGKRSSHGCIRLYPEDIAVLFPLLKAGTPVTVIDAPYKLGWQGGNLLLEVTPTQEQSDEIADYQQPRAVSIPEIYPAIEEMAGDDPISWYVIEEAVLRRDGLPVTILKAAAE